VLFTACTTKPGASAAKDTAACCAAKADAADGKACCAEKAADGLLIIATVHIHEGYKDELQKAFQDVIAATRKEAGCLSYNVYEDINNPSTMTFVEYWASQADIDRHNQTPHLQALVKALEGKAHMSVAVMKHKL